MKEAVNKILMAEEQARKAVEKAHQQSQEIVFKANEEAGNMMEEALEEVNLLIEKKRDESIRGFISEKEKELQDTRQKISALRQQKDKSLPDIAKKLFLRIIQADV